MVKDRKAQIIRFKKPVLDLVPQGSGSSEKQSFFALLPLKSLQRIIPEKAPPTLFNLLW